MAKQQYKVFVLNLKKDTERREYITKHLKDRGIEFELIEGVYGKDLSQQQLDTLVDIEAAKKIINRDISIGEIGCSLSHQKIYKRILADNLDGAFIFEDDAYTCKDIKRIMDTIYDNRSKFTKKFWLVMSQSYINVYKKIFKIDSQYSVYKGPKIYCTDAYYIDNAAAKKLIKLNSPVKYTADWFRCGYIRKLNIFAINNACNLHDLKMDLSVIDADRTISKSQQSLLIKFKDLCKRIYFYKFTILLICLGVYKKAPLSKDLLKVVEQKDLKK